MTKISDRNAKSSIVIIPDGTTITGEPKPGLRGEDRFTYPIGDGKGSNTTPTVVVLVVKK